MIIIRSSNVSFSFAWKDLNSIKKKRKSAAIEKEDDFINALTCSMAAEDEVSVAVEDRGSSSCPSSQPDQPLSVPSSSYDCEAAFAHCPSSIMSLTVCMQMNLMWS